MEKYDIKNKIKTEVGSEEGESQNETERWKITTSNVYNYSKNKAYNDLQEK